MKKTFRLFKRNQWFYSVEIATGTQKTLKTKDKAEAEQMLAALNAPDESTAFKREMGRIFLQSAEPELNTRIWRDVMKAMAAMHKPGPTRSRYETALKDKTLRAIYSLKIIETTSKVFMNTLSGGTVSTNIYLRRMHNFALGMSWLLAPILPKKLWPRIVHKIKRAVTPEEHSRIITREPNTERRAYYEVLWWTGGAQSDVAHLEARDIDWDQGVVSFDRMKTKANRNVSHADLTIGHQLERLLRSLPSTGKLFPYLAKVRAGDRATEFKQRCDALKIYGISLHSYRYSWAERAKKAGMGEREAMQALGHQSKAIHRFYAKRARLRIPSLEELEQLAQKKKIVPFINIESPPEEPPAAAEMS